MSDGEEAEGRSGTDVSILEPGMALKLNLKREDRDGVEGAEGRSISLL